jgi:hypothetical protein
MAHQYQVYCYTHTESGKRYIGVTRDSLKKRAGSAGSYYRGSPLFFAAIQKHGWVAFSGETLLSGLTKKEASKKEKQYIDLFSSRDPAFGYNLQVGGFPENGEPSGHLEQRNARIRATLVKQRTDPTVREQMSLRMLREWGDSSKRAARLRARAASNGGRPSVRVLCVDTGQTFNNLREAATFLGKGKALVARKLHALGDEHPFQQTTTGTVLRMRRIT